MRAALLLLLLFACGEPPLPPAADAARARPGTPLPPPAPTAILPSQARTPTVATMTLDEPGSLPRRVLRYESSPGVTRYPLAIRYRGKDLRYRVERTTTVAGREVVHALRAIPERDGRGLGGQVTVDERGWSREVHLAFARGSAIRPDEPIETLHRVLALPAIPLPVEPIGRGARWHYRDRVLRAGAIIDRRLEVELVRLEGTRARLKLTLEEQAPRQRLVATPDLPAGARVTLVRTGTTGEGEALVDLGGGPATLRLRVRPSFTYEMVADRQSESMSPSEPEPLEVRVGPAGS